MSQAHTLIMIGVLCPQVLANPEELGEYLPATEANLQKAIPLATNLGKNLYSAICMG